VGSKVYRPSLDDVERLSQGLRAKNRGAGSRGICHRLNQEERKLYLMAKQKGYLNTQGNSYRHSRKGSPLVNTFRQWCDASDRIYIGIEKYTDYDRVVIDISTRRLLDYRDHRSQLLRILEESDEIGIAIEHFEDCYHSSEELRKPIWSVPEKIVQVDCSRDSAKKIVKILVDNPFLSQR